MQTHGLRLGVFLLSIILGWLGKGWACPSPEKVAQSLKGLFKGSEVRVLKVTPSPVKGLCEVLISQGKRRGLTYIDESGKFLVAGRIIEIANRRDLTREKIAELNRIKLSPEKMRELRKYVAFSAGSGPEVFFITDPDCPFCKQAEKILWDLIQDKKIKVNVVFFPLERLHPKAKDKAIALICEGKGFEELLMGYSGERTCPEGKKKVEEGMNFVKSLGITGTPTYIFPSGIAHSGVLNREKLLQMVKDGS